MSSRKNRKRPPLPVVVEPVIDSHCHLDPESLGGVEQLDQLIERAWSAGLRGLVAIGSGYGSASAGIAMRVAERYPGRIWATVGLHPHDASQWTPTMGRDLAGLAASPQVVGIGETGLDFHYDRSPRPVQRRVFRYQAELALELAMPLVVHDRESGAESLDILQACGAFQGRGVLFHCFSGDLARMERLVELGAFISIPGVVTFPGAHDMRRVAAAVPGDRLLVETDSPFLTPVPWRGHRNQPAMLLYTLAEIARLRGITLDQAAALTTRNTRRFFGLPPLLPAPPGRSA